MWGAPCGVLVKEIEEESALFFRLIDFTLTDALLCPVTAPAHSSVDVRTDFFWAEDSQLPKILWALNARLGLLRCLS